jgi:hypothetical protein
MDSLLGYIGPDQLLPFASLLAAGVGVVLMFWRWVVGWGKKPFQLLFAKKDEPAANLESES